MLFHNPILVLASALVVDQALALSGHHHAHRHAHDKKRDVAYAHTAFTTVVEWVTVTKDGDEESTPAPEPVFKGAAYSEHYQPAAKPSPAPEVKPAEPAAKPAEPAAKPVEPAAKPAEPAAKPVEPVKPAPAVGDVAIDAAAALPKLQASSGGSKRGLAYNAGALVNSFTGGDSKCSWTYNWGQIRDGADKSGLEWVPMMWSPGPLHEPTWKDNAEKAIKNGAKNMLSFNECDNGGQANMGPGEAAKQHKRLLNPYGDSVRIGTPSITNSHNAGEGIDWLKQFLSACGGQCKYDFCAIHWYSPPDVSEFMGHLMEAHAACKKPIWLTEFAPSGDEQQKEDFLKEAMHQMDTNSTLSFVERYSYYMVAEGSLVSGAKPNDLGKLFAFS